MYKYSCCFYLLSFALTKMLKQSIIGLFRSIIVEKKFFLFHLKLNLWKKLLFFFLHTAAVLMAFCCLDYIHCILSFFVSLLHLWHQGERNFFLYFPFLLFISQKFWILIRRQTNQTGKHWWAEERLDRLQQFSAKYLCYCICVIKITVDIFPLIDSKHFLVFIFPAKPCKIFCCCFC